MFFGFVAFGGKAIQPFDSGNCVVVWPWYPGPPKNHLAKQTHFGMPLMAAVKVSYNMILVNFRFPACPPPESRLQMPYFTLLTAPAVFKAACQVFLVHPLPRGVPGEGPDCRFPSEAGVLGRIRRGNL